MEPTERQTSHDSKEQEPSFRRRRSDATQVVIDTNVKPEEGEETGQGQPANEKEKKGPPASWSRRLWNVVKPPPFVQFRKAIKMAIAILLALIMTLDDSCRNAIGAGALLTCVVIVFYFPSRTVGAVAEDAFYGTFGALIASAWMMLAIFLADLSRDESNPNPVQPPSSGILAVFFVIGVFIFTYIRLEFTRAKFGCIIACILLAFSTTQAAMTKGFIPALVWQYLIPISLGGGLAVAVASLIWPDDSLTTYMNVLDRCLDGFNQFFKEHSEAFLATSPTSLNSTLPSLHERLQSGVLMLIDCKRVVYREITFSRLNSNDVRNMTKIIKTMRAPLHGIGLSWILKKDLLTDENGDKREKETLKASIREIQEIYMELSNGCVDAIAECRERLKPFHGEAQRSTMDSILWPFPRLYSFRKADSKDAVRRTAAQQLQNALNKLDDQAGRTVHILLQEHYRRQHIKHHNTGLYLLSLYRFNLREFVHAMINLLAFIDQIEQERSKRRIWMPSHTLRKWFHHSDVDPNVGGDAGDYDTSPHDLTLVRTNTLNDALEDETSRSAFITNTSGKMYYRDPDVDPPRSRSQYFFNMLYKAKTWFFGTNPFFAFKAASAAVLVGLPAFLPQSAAWYSEWRGQWAIIVLMFWMAPTHGFFFFATIMRVAGTIGGGITGIIVWEISRGNPYGIGVLCFFISVGSYYVFIFKVKYRVMAMLYTVTMLLVTVYEFDYVVTNSSSWQPVYTVAGKRMLLVTIGLAAAVVVSMFPYPMTGRVELRKRLAYTLRDIGRLYGVLTVNLVMPSLSNKRPTEEQIKGFRKLTLDIRRQIADERTFLKLSAYEPPLRGDFPADRYGIMLDKVDNMTDLVYAMGHSLHSMDPKKQRQVALTVTEARRDYLASIMTTIKLLAATLSAKMSLPPYLIAPNEARDRLTRALENGLKIRPEEINSPSFLALGTYFSVSSAFTAELQDMLETTEDLVGVEDPQEWLRQHI